MEPESLVEAYERGELADVRELAPAVRYRVYLQIAARRLSLKLRPLLRALFELELVYRLRDDDDLDDDGDHFENIYLCGALLFDLGVVEDVELLARAKFSRDMDLGTGFDIHCLFGAGVDETLDYLSSLSTDWAKEAHEYARHCHAAGDLDNLADWRAGVSHYFSLEPRAGGRPDRPA
ncbi:MAG: hypothetical protein ACRBN8_39675 [Nannocystales bacterium]